MGAPIPDDLKKYISLKEAFDRLGAQLFGEEWIGDELNAVPLKSIENAEIMFSELTTHQVWLKENSYFNRWLKDNINENVEEFVEEAIALDEATFDLSHVLAEPDQYSGDYIRFVETIFAIYRLSKYFSYAPSLKGDDYREAYNAFHRRQQTEQILLELLQNGAITAFFIGAEGPEAISVDIWKVNARGVNIAENNLKIEVTGRYLEKVEFIKTDFEKIKKKIPRASAQHYDEKSTFDRAVKKRLSEILQQPCDGRTKEDIEELMLAEFPDLKPGTFKNAWKIVTNRPRTHASWTKSGPRSKNKSAN
jgi:hypothetical protein